MAKALKKNIKNMDIFDSYEHVAHYSKETFKDIINKSNFIIEKIYAPMPIHPLFGQNILISIIYTPPWFWDWKKVDYEKIISFNWQD